MKIPLPVPLASGLSLILLAACAQPGQRPEPGDALNRALAHNAEAVGGKARFEALQAIRLEVNIEEPTFEVTGTYVATRSGFVRVDVYAGGQREFSEALGPSGGWQWHD